MASFGSSLIRSRGRGNRLPRRRIIETVGIAAPGYAGRGIFTQHISIFINRSLWMEPPITLDGTGAMTLGMEHLPRKQGPPTSVVYPKGAIRLRPKPPGAGIPGESPFPRQASGCTSTAPPKNRRREIGEIRSWARKGKKQLMAHGRSLLDSLLRRGLGGGGDSGSNPWNKGPGARRKLAAKFALLIRRICIDSGSTWGGIDWPLGPWVN